MVHQALACYNADACPSSFKVATIVAIIVVALVDSVHDHGQ
jgi:hypothetical protein